MARRSPVWIHVAHVGLIQCHEFILLTNAHWEVVASGGFIECELWGLIEHPGFELSSTSL